MARNQNAARPARPPRRASARRTKPSRPGAAATAKPRPAASRALAGSRQTTGAKAATTRAAPAGEPSALQRLHDTLAALDGKVRAVGAPIHAVKETIHALKAPLDLPPKIIRGLDDAHVALSAARLVTTGLSWVPGAIGTGAKAADRALKPMLQSPPPPRGILRNARDTTAEIDRGLKPVREAIGRVSGPVDRAAGAIDAVESRLATLIGAVDRLLRHHGASPPPGVESCAARLEAPLSTALQAIEQFQAKAGKALARLSAALGALLEGLRPLSDIAATLDRVLSALAAKPIRDMLAVLRKLVGALEPYRRWAEFALKRVINAILRKLGISLAAIERFFDRLIGAIDPLKPLAGLLADARRKLEALGRELLAAMGVDELLARLEAIRQELEREIDAFLQGACGKVFLPKTAPA